MFFSRIWQLLFRSIKYKGEETRRELTSSFWLSAIEFNIDRSLSGRTSTRERRREFESLQVRRLTLFLPKPKRAYAKYCRLFQCFADSSIVPTPTLHQYCRLFQYFADSSIVLTPTILTEIIFFFHLYFFLRILIYFHFLISSWCLHYLYLFFSLWRFLNLKMPKHKDSL